MVLANELDKATLDFHKQGVVLYYVEEPRGFTGPSEDRIEGDYALLALGIDLLPLEEVFPFRGDAPDPAFASIGQNDDGVVPEELGDGDFVVPQVVGEGSMKLPM